LRKKTEKNII